MDYAQIDFRLNVAVFVPLFLENYVLRSNTKSVPHEVLL